MTVHTLSTTATDTLAASDSDTVTITSTAETDLRVVTRSLFANRINWDSVVSATIQGPTFSDDTPEPTYITNAFECPPSPLTLAVIFKVLIPVRLTGCRIYKAPNAEGTDIDVVLWSGTAAPGTELMTTTIDEWVVDAGGWQQVDFTPVDLTPDVAYVLAYHSQDGIYAYSHWVFQGQDSVTWPLHVEQLFSSPSAGNSKGTASGGFGEAAIEFPTRNLATNFYIDPQVEWDDQYPGYDGGVTYWDQWTHTDAGKGRHDFPVGVYFADPPFLQAYYDLGVNTLIAGPVDAAYIEAMNDMGNTMDWWPYVGSPPHDVVQVEAEEPGVGEQIVGYLVDDEPDISSPYRSPDVLRTWANYMRVRNSTKPLRINFSGLVGINQSFHWSPSGAAPLTVNELWRDWADIADVISFDAYTLSDGYDPNDRYGVWTYAAQIGRLREICDDRKPVWAVVETTSQTPGQPVADDVYKAIWATLIAGARGIILFDHRFASDLVTADFNAIHDNPTMAAMITDLAALLQTLGTPLHAPDLGLVTAYTSSNTTSGPKGGTFGVPIHYTSREDATYEYVFAQAIRPGATTATLTIPTWASEVVTVIDEARTETVSVGGVLTDSFAADYQVHLYQRTK